MGKLVLGTCKKSAHFDSVFKSSFWSKFEKTATGNLGLLSTGFMQFSICKNWFTIDYK